MSKLTAALIALALVPVLNAQAQQVKGAALNQNVNGMAGWYNFVPSFRAAPTEFVNLRDAIMQSHTIDVNSDSNPSVCTFRLEGSSDGLNWFDISGTQDCTSPQMYHVPDRPVRLVRVNVLSFTGITPLRFFYTGTR